MTFQRSMLFACCALLTACAGTGPASTTAATKAPTVASAMAAADAAVLAGRTDEACNILRQAGIAFPADKTPWLRLAQMRFDATDYGQAIVNAQAALDRDPDDTLAHSIVAVSGLRVTSKALADLSQKNNLTGNVRTEAQELAKLLRANLNEDALVPGARSAGRKDTTRRAATTQAAAPAPASKSTGAAAGASTASSDPFGALK